MKYKKVETNNITEKSVFGYVEYLKDFSFFDNDDKIFAKEEYDEEFKLIDELTEKYKNNKDENILQEIVNISCYCRNIEINK